MHRTTMVTAALVLLATASAASATPRISIGPVRNDAKAIIPTQLAKALCGPFECVVWPEVSSKGQVDFAKARAAGATGVLSGSVARTDTSATLTLWLFTTSTQPRLTWSFPLTATGALKADAMAKVERDLAAALRPAAPPPVAASSAPAAAAAVVAPVPQPQAPSSPAPPSTAQAPRPQAAEPGPPPPAPAGAPSSKTAEPPVGRWILAGELGLLVMQRELTYSGVTPSAGSLLGFDASSITGPAVRVELYPAAHGDSAVLGGLGLIGAYQASVGLKTLAPTGEERPTSYSRLQLGAAWRSPSLAGHVVLLPTLSWQALKLAVSPPIDGLANADLTGLKIGLGAEVELGDRVVLLAGAGWVDWFTARELVGGSPPFFPSGSASALEAELGAGVRIWRSISLRLLGEYSATSYTLHADPGGGYQATGASDRYLGLRAVVRGTY